MASNRTVQPVAQGQPSGPPLPKVAYKVVNPIMKALLRSPLHRLLSNSLMVLSFHGRKSGKHYHLPVGYLQKSNRLYVFSHTPWWKNFRGGAPVTVRLRGKNIRGTATVIDDPDVIADAVGMMVAKNGEPMARRMGLISDAPDTAIGAFGPPRLDTVFIEIKLEE